MNKKSEHRCGTVALIGRPNVGKSTLLNHMLGEKIAIVSPKPETTRDKMLGILTVEGAQVLFIDTPGIYHGPRTLLAKHQIRMAQDTLAEADVILFLTEGHIGLTDLDKQILHVFPKVKPDSVPERPVFLAINKVDKVKKPLLLPQMQQAHETYPFADIIPISARDGDNMDALLKALIEKLPVAPPVYPPDDLTDRPMREIVQEIIREKALIFTSEEVPHAVAVLVEEWRPGELTEEAKNALANADESTLVKPARTYVRATVYVERDSQKGILIGKKGALLKQIGETARAEIEPLVDQPVFLDLWVKVAKNWRKDPKFLKLFGYS